MVKRAEILDAARTATCDDRNKTYGDPRANWGLTAALWSEYLGVEITPSQASICMALVKVARLKHSPDHFDSFVDAAAYMAIAGECSTKQET